MMNDFNSSISNSVSSTPNAKWASIGSIFREEGHIYSLAAAGNMLYTGSECNSVRVWKNMKAFSGFKSTSGMVKAIVLLNGKIFTGHQDGKIRVWTLFDDKPTRLGYLPKTKHLLLKSLSPKSYVKVKRNRNVPWIKHYDAVSCMSVDEYHGLLYSGSWDKTLKIWRISDSKCLESVAAHDDAVNSVMAAPGEMVFTGSADGTLKAWRREFVGRRTEHFLEGVLMNQEHAVTAVAGVGGGGAVYAGSSDGLVRFWEVGKRMVACGGVLRGHKVAVLCLVAVGRLVMSGSADKSICVWRRGSGGVHECVAVLRGHGGPVKCLAAEEEGRRRWIVYSGSLDKSVKVWRVSE
ncbi:hypothetical protein SASPL_101139 [Salvia splendens]|uniref:Uncharacterized protein n=1 Tax=Salvia splendens TaxID=180675 RepID=A0A8X8YNR0_SALSN|nr:protein JINGUBANG-like [Salvia splendens]KAG6436253.1 hypothetical protein SASPL_101139 [Salvia splendens]